MSDNKRKRLSIKDKFEIIMEIKSGVKRELILSQYKLQTFSHFTVNYEKQ